MDIQPIAVNAKSLYSSSNTKRIQPQTNQISFKALKQDTVSFTSKNVADEFNGETIYLYEDINKPDMAISGEKGQQEISIIADLNVKTIRNSYAPIKIANCNVATSYVKNDFKDISIFEAGVKATNKINNDSGNIDVFASNIDSRYVKNSHGNISIKDSTVNASVINSWGDTEVLLTNNSKCIIDGKVTNEWGNISSKGESKDNKVVITGDVINTSGFVSLKNTIVKGTLKASGDRIHLNNSEVQNLVIDANYDQNVGKNLFSRMINSITNNTNDNQTFVLKNGNKISGDVTFVNGHGKLIVEDGAEFNGEVKGGELVRN